MSWAAGTRRAERGFGIFYRGPVDVGARPSPLPFSLKLKALAASQGDKLRREGEFFQPDKPQTLNWLHSVPALIVEQCRGFPATDIQTD